MLDRNEIRKIDAKVVSEISWKIANFMRGMAPADSQLNFVLVYLAYVALTNEIDDIEDLLFFIEDKISEQRAMFAKEIFKQAGMNVNVIPVTTAAYALSKAARPFNSRLDKRKLVENGFEPLPEWKDAVGRYISIGINR